MHMVCNCSFSSSTSAVLSSMLAQAAQEQEEQISFTCGIHSAYCSVGEWQPRTLLTSHKRKLSPGSSPGATANDI